MKNKQNLSLSLRKVILSALVAAPMATLPAPLWALPVTTSANLASSSSATTYQVSGVRLDITDTVATRLVMRWNEFGGGSSLISSGETVSWTLPTTASAVLNLVSTGATTVNGTLDSNGTIFIVNPNGITLSSTSAVTAAGFGVSTINEPDFFFANNGTLAFSGTATNAVTVASSSINVGSTGTVYVAGKTADVSGTIQAGTLNVTTQNGLVRLGQAAALSVGTNATSSTAGWGNLVVNSNGGAIQVGAGNSVTIRGGNATLTTGGAAVNGLTTTTIGAAGSGYTSVPTVTVSAPNLAGGVPATAVATIDTNGAVTGVTFTNVGSGYTSAPTITISGVGTGATATATAPASSLFAVGDSINNSTLTINTSGTGTVTLNNLTANNSTIRNGVTLNAGSTQINTNRIALNTGTVNGNITVVANGTIDTGGDVTVSGGVIRLSTTGNNQAINFKGPGDLTFTTLGTNNSTGSAVTLVSTTGSVSLPTATIGGSLTVTAQTNIVQSGTLTNTAGGSRTATFNAVTGNVTLTDVNNDFTRLVLVNAPGGAQVNDINSLTIGGGTNATGSVVINSNLGTTFGTASDSSITFGSTLTLTSGSSAASASVSAGGTGYTTAPTVFVSSPNMTSGVQATATATIDTNGVVTGITFTNAGSGYLSAPTISFSGGGGSGAVATSTVSAAGITDVTNNITVLGAVTLNSTGILLDGATDNGVGLAHRFGALNATASTGGVRIYESTTANIGNISTSGTVRIYSSAGDVINSGAITGSPALQVGAGSAVTPGNVTLNNAGNVIGSVTVLDDFTLLSNASAPGATVGSYLTRDLSVSNSGSITLNQISSTSNTGIAGSLTLVASGTASNVSIPNPIRVGGAVTLTAGNTVSASNTLNAFSTLNLTAGGNATSVVTTGNLTATVSLAQNQSLTPSTALVRAFGTLTLGAVNSDYTGLVTFQSGDNGTASLQDSVAGIRVFGPVQFTSGGSVTINRAGHSFGRVGVSTGNNRSATIVESGTLRLGTVSINGSGSFTATSTSGDILTDVTANGISVGNGNSSVSLTASAGNITIDDNAGPGNSIVGRINATAAGSVSIAQNRSTVLGNITAGGRLTVELSGVGASITTAGSYTVAPTVQVSAPNIASGVQAAATVTLDTNGAINAIVWSNGGSGYTSAPTVTLVGGTFTTAGVLTGTLGNSTVSQATGTRLNVYDTVTFNAGGSGDININQTGNRMGGVIARANTGNITLTESTTLNLKSVLTTGTLAATSENANIIDSGDTSVAVNSIGTSSSAIGAATFTASNGNVVLSLAGSNYSTVGFTTGGNVAISDGFGGTVLANSVIGGTFDVTSLTSGQLISQPLGGSIRANGNVSFITNNGTITLSGSANEFGGVRFVAGNGGVSINENTTFNLRPSTSTGPVNINTNGSFVTSTGGTTTVNGDVYISAAGTITPGASSLFVTGNLTVFSTSTKDLSALSKSGNLAGRDPVNQGSGSYVPPSP